MMNEQFITPIQPMRLWGGVERTGDAGRAAQLNGTGGLDTFKGIFREAVSNVKETDADLTNKQYLLATGQIEDAHTVQIAASQAQLSVDMLVSLRNKALESYNELMRINL